MLHLLISTTILLLSQILVSINPESDKKKRDQTPNCSDNVLLNFIFFICSTSRIINLNFHQYVLVSLCDVSMQSYFLALMIKLFCCLWTKSMLNYKISLLHLFLDGVFALPLSLFIVVLICSLCSLQKAQPQMGVSSFHSRQVHFQQKPLCFL